MGSGKSTIGRRLAQRLGWDCIDTDHLIEAREGRSIAEIFSQSGEDHFRKLEAEMIKEVLGYTKAVISTGGGAILNPENLQELLTRAHVICLWLSPEEAYERTRHHSHRPLLQAPDPLARITEILEEREPLYKQAHYLVNTVGRSILEITDSIIRYVDRQEPDFGHGRDTHPPGASGSGL